MKNRLKIVLTFLSLIIAANVFAQQGQGVAQILEAYLITVDSSGNEIQTPITEENSGITPGDVIEYRQILTNNLDNGITQLQPVLPIPIGMEYVLESASPSPEGASLSNTGNTFQRLPLTRTVRQPDGTTVEEEVPGREYRRLRWLVPSLEAGDQVILVARVKVIDN